MSQLVILAGYKQCNNDYKGLEVIKVKQMAI